MEIKNLSKIIERWGKRREMIGFFAVIIVSVVIGSLYVLFNPIHLTTWMLGIFLFLFFIIKAELILYFAVLITALFQPLQVFTLPIGRSNFHFIDLLFVCIVSVMLANLFMRTITFPQGQTKRWVFFLIFMLVFPILPSLFKKEVRFATVFRDTRPAFYYMATLFFAVKLKSKEDIKKLLKFILLISTLGIVHYYVMRILGKPFYSGMSIVPLRSGEFIRTYGFHSTYYYMLLGFFVLLRADVFYFKKIKILRYFLIGLYLSTILLLLIRSFFLGLVGGCLVMAYFNRRQLIQNLGKVLVIGVLLLSVVVVVGSFFSSSGGIEGNIFIERYGSIINKDLSTRSAAANLDYRVGALKMVWDALKQGNVFGKGYGEALLHASGLYDRETLGFLGHSTYAWIIYRMGLVGLIGMIILFTGLLMRMVWIRSHLQDMEVVSLLDTFIAFFISLLLIGFGSNVLFGRDVLLPAITCGIFISVENIYLKEKGLIPLK